MREDKIYLKSPVENCDKMMKTRFAEFTAYCIWVSLYSCMAKSDDDARSFFHQKTTISPQSLPPPSKGVIDVAMILLNINTNNTEQVIVSKCWNCIQRLHIKFQSDDKLVTYFTKMIDSIFLYSQRTPLRLIFLTDEASREVIGDILMNRAGRYLSHTILTNPSVTGRDITLMFPKISVVYVRADDIFKNQKKGIHQLRYTT